MSDDLFVLYREYVLEAVRSIVPGVPEDVVARIELTPTRDPSHGDMATNAALLLSKSAKRKPADIAHELAGALRSVKGVAEASPAGPGFVNIRLQPQVYQEVLPVILDKGAHFGDSAIGQGIRVNVEYVSANPTGPMHVGHCRGAVVGDALANLLLKTGFDVTKEYYINDAGTQVAALSWAAYWRYLQAAGTSLTEEEYEALVPGGLQYRGDYLIPVGQALFCKHGQSLAAPGGGAAPPSVWFDIVRKEALEQMLTSIRQDLAALGVDHDVFTSEAAILQSGIVDQSITRFEQKGLLYEGVLEPPKGKKPDDWESRPQTLFRATDFGDDVDRPLRKSDGSNTYFANDIGYHADKIRRGADILIDVLGADHGGYVARMRAAVRALSEDTRFEALLCQIVRVVRNGEPVRMSKRAGTFVTLRELLDEVGRDAVRFTMLTRKADAQMEFDLDQVVAQSRDNPVFYVNYAHARCCSVLRMAAEQMDGAALSGAALSQGCLSHLSSEAELALIKRLAAWPRAVQAAARAWEPHRIAFYLMELAAEFHGLWNRGRDEAALRFIQPSDVEGTRARLALVEATAVVLRCGFEILGVNPVEEMR